MAKFKYIAEDKTRTRKEGFRKADSESEVTEWIYGSDLKPISIGEVRPKKKTEKPTTQDTAKIFITLAEVIKEKANKCSPLENVSVAEANNRKEELQRSYLIDRLSVEALTKRTKKHLDKDLQETPALLGNDYFTGMINLSDHCRDCAAILTGKEKPAEITEKKVWSHPTNKTNIVSVLRLTNVKKLNTCIKAGVYEVEKIDKNRELWRIRIDKLPLELQNKLR